MATTNRQFDDERIVNELKELNGFNPGGATGYDLDIEVSYEAPTMNGVPRATVTVTTSFEFDVDTADAILFGSK